MTPSFEKLTHFGLSMGKLRSKSHPTMIAIATDRWRPAEHWKANLRMGPATAVLTAFLAFLSCRKWCKYRLECFNYCTQDKVHKYSKGLKTLGQLDVSQSF